MMIPLPPRGAAEKAVSLASPSLTVVRDAVKRHRPATTATSGSPPLRGDDPVGGAALAHRNAF